MAKAKLTRRASQLAQTGLKELPSNAAWVLSKALRPAVSGAAAATNVGSSVGGGTSDALASVAETADTATSGARRSGRAARQAVAKAVPGIGHDSVASLMQQADAAAEQARLKEARALSLAEDAKNSADEAERVARESDQLLSKVRDEAERTVTARVEEAEQRERLAAEAAARKTVDTTEAKVSARTRDRQQNAERAQLRAREAIQEANEALTRARDLAAHAAKAAKEVATQRSREADRLAAQARERAAAAERRATETSRMAMAATAAGPAKAPSARSSAGLTLTEQQYGALTKEQLLRLAAGLEVEGQSAMNKQDLIQAVGRAGGVSFNALTKEELLRVARHADQDVATSMTKSELIATVTAS
jgi:colicin import membrane protein